MQLRDIVEINQNGLVADAVNFKMMADERKNLPLCTGFVFNYDVNHPKFSTVGVLDALRESFHSVNNANIHLMVQDFGKGKSHFALTVANFFKQPAGSPEVEGILHQIQFATSEQSLAIYERLKAYKERTKPYLVICISGEVQVDLGKMLIQALRRALEEHGIEDAIAQHFIQKPLTYLQDLSAEKRTEAQQYLKQIGQPHGDLDMMIELLAEDNYDIIPTVVELSEHLEGFAFNFEYNLDLEKILEDVIENLCTGEAPQFEGILLLFDELNAYLRTWLKNPQAAGNYALQNITNVCGRHRGKIALLCLAQVKPSLDTQVRTLDRKNYERFTSRIELAPSTYEPKSSLELVIDNLLRQSEGFQWQAFHDRWGNTLLGESRSVYEKYITAYQPNDSSLGKFHRHLGLGCYPLHPLTAYLLCNLEFTQGRTAIQFIKEDVVRFIDSTPVEVEGRLKLVRPVQLMDAFKSNFAQQSFYNDYQKAYNAIAASANSEEITVLKAIGLYYLSGDKITKPSHEHQGDLLAVMTGFSINKTKYILTQLTDEYQVIYYNSGNKTYRFYSGFSLNDLRRKLEEEIAERTPQLNDLIKECRKNLSHYLGSETIRADEFVNTRRLHSEEWQFEQQIFAIDQFERLLTTERFIKGLTERGLIAYFIGEYTSDLEEIETKAEDVLASAPQAVQERVILAIPQKGTGKLSRILLMRDTLHKKNIREKQEFGPALAELGKQFDEQLTHGLQDIFESCVYTCRVIHKIPQVRRRNLEAIVSKMLEDLYFYVPPVDNQDKLRLKSTSGSQIISFASRQLLVGDLKEPFPNKSYKNLIKPVFIDRWRLLQSGTPYTVQVPKDPAILQAWDTISEMTDIGDQEKRVTPIKEIWETLSAAPFGHNELTFTILFTAWLAYHRAEVELHGEFGIPKKKSEKVTHRSAAIQEWAGTNILDKVKDFVHNWIVPMGSTNQVIRHKPIEITVPEVVNYDEAHELLQKIKIYRQMNQLDPSKISLLEDLDKKAKQLEQGIQIITTWYNPTTEAEELLKQEPTLAELANYYTPLEKSLPITIKEGVTTVSPTEEQKNAQRQTCRILQDKIETRVKDLLTQSTTFKIPDQGTTLTVNIEAQIKSLESIAEFPPRFVNDLKTACHTINERIQQLKDSEQTREVLTQIQDLYQTLGANASQNQYQGIRERIEELARQNPRVQQHQTYCTILDEINTQHDELIRKLDQWESHFTSLSSKDEAYQLSQDVNREITRFDQPDHQQQINSLNERLRVKILEQEEDSKRVENLERQAEKAQSSADIEDVIGAIAASRTQLHDLNPYQNRLQALATSLQQRRQQSINATQQWLSDLQSQSKQLDVVDEPSQKLDMANNLLHNIQQTRHQHEEFLEEKDVLKELEQKCRAVQNQDRASQIETLFKELPKEEQLALYQRLSAYLETTTEVF